MSDFNKSSKGHHHIEKRGRFTNYDPVWTPLVVKSLMMLGKTVVQVCNELHISTETIYSWAKLHPELKQAIDEGREPVNENVISALYRAAIGYTVSETIWAEKPISKEEMEERARMKNPPPLPKIPVEVKKHYVRPSVTAQMFWLKNKLPNDWKDQHDVNMAGKMEYSVIPFTESSMKESDDE